MSSNSSLNLLAMPNREDPSSHCAACTCELPPASRFCPRCGVRTHSQTISPRALALCVLFALILWGSAWGLNTQLIGDRPTQTLDDAAISGIGNLAQREALLREARLATQRTPKDAQSWQTLAALLIQEIQTGGDPQGAMITDLIDSLSQLLQINPRDTEALRTMAEISFERQAFDKSAQFYRRYLELVPSDFASRARLGSSLTFIGDLKTAQTELNRVITEQPKHFPALAYLAITYSQAGDKQHALEFADRALKSAPNDQVRDEFKKFVDKLKGASTLPLPRESQSAIPPVKETATNAAEIVASYIKRHPIAGPKFLRSEEAPPGVVTLLFQGFPMDQIPPAVREKFLTKLKEFCVAHLANFPLHTVRLIDSSSQQQMAEINLEHQ